MLIDAKFSKVDGIFLTGISRRGIPVKIRNTAEVQAALLKNETLTVQCIAELYDRYYWHKQAVECVLPAERLGIDGKPVKFNR